MSLHNQFKKINVRLLSKPTAELCVKFSQGTSNTLVVFLNGLGLPQTSWIPTITRLLESCQPASSIVTYDRYGQGETVNKDPLDEGKEPGHGHDLEDVVKDLDALLSYMTGSQHLDLDANFCLILVGNSIGCSVARYYAQTNPGRVSALLLLDPTLANSDFVSFYPDTEAPGFDESCLLGKLTREQMVSATRAIGAVFHPNVANKEGFNRRSQCHLLPLSDGPQLIGPNGGGPFLTVVGHDFEVFADETTKMPGVVRDIAIYYTNPYWHRYNQDLMNITIERRRKGPLIAERAGHFIQRDRPDFVADELIDLLQKLKHLNGGEKS